MTKTPTLAAKAAALPPEGAQPSWGGPATADRWKPNVTVAAIIEREGRFLMVEEESADGLKLNNPAGHIDSGESPEEGCIRETLEETAWEFRPTALVGVYLSRKLGSVNGDDVTYLRFAFTGELGRHHAARALDSGIVRTLWMTPQEIRDSAGRHRSPLVLRGIEDYLAGQRHPLSLIHTDPSVHLP